LFVEPRKDYPQKIFRWGWYTGWRGVKESLYKLKRRIGFLYAELGLAAGRDLIAKVISAKIGRPVKLARLFKGSGWGLKYLVYEQGESSPAYLVKAASLIIERRFQHVMGRDYLTYPERFKMESEILSALARIGLGPCVILCEKDFFVRGFLPGFSLVELPLPDIKKWLPKVLKAIDLFCDSGIFHTDPNSANVIVDPGEGKIGFIDSEIPTPGSDKIVAERAKRAFCHERLLYSLGRDLRKKAGFEPESLETLFPPVKDYYDQSAGGILSPKRAIDLLIGRVIQIEISS
jgi:hypothetical protein